MLFNKLNPLVEPRAKDGSLSLHTLSWDDVKAWVGEDHSRVFKGADGKDEKALGEVNAFFTGDPSALSQEEKTQHFINQVSQREAAVGRAARTVRADIWMSGTARPCVPRSR